MSFKIPTLVKKFKFSIIAITALVTVGAGGLIFIESGVYDIAAATPHAIFTRKMLKKVQRNSISRHARDLKTPDLNKVSLIKKGFKLYRQNCVSCHGAPGEGRSRTGIGLNPNPPPLMTAAKEWQPKEIAWTIANGLKMAGMPAYILGESPDDIWAMTAFVLRMNKLNPKEYRKMMAWEKGDIAENEIPWLYEKQEGWEQLSQQGRKERGKKLLESRGCIACHEIPGVGYSRAQMGPGLFAWKKRHFISGQILNHPINLVAWIKNPQKFEPQTVMPDLNISDDEAWDMAAYLFTLGD